MSDFTVFMQLGFRHIVALDAADHVLFLLALAAIYRGRDWRSMLWVITAFTVGHSLTLALVATGALAIPIRLVEFLIPLTIVATGIENLLLRGRAGSATRMRYRPVFAALFGLVHGAGFAGYLRSLFVDEIAAPLFAFNVGIELGQIVVLASAFAMFWIADRVLAAVPALWPGRPRFEVRVIGVSALVTAVAATWTLERWPL
jgi:hypothetical protein